MSELRVVIECDDKNLRIAFGTGRGRQVSISRVRQYGMRSASREAMTSLLATAGEGRSVVGASAFVAISDRRIVHGMVQRSARPSSQDLAQLLSTEARRLGQYAAHEELVIGYTERHWDGAWQAHLEVAPRPVVDEIAAAVTAAGMRRLRMASIEALLAAALAQDAQPIGILELRREQARLVLARDGVVLATRKMRMPLPLDHLSDGAEALLPLHGELRRSLEYFKDHQLPAPERIVLLGECEIDSELTDWSDSLGVPIEAVQHEALELVPEELEHKSAWLVPAVVLSGVPADRVAFLMEPPSRLKTISFRRALLQGASLLALVAGVLLVRDAQSPEHGQRRTELAAAQLRRVQLEEELRNLEQQHQEPAILAQRRQAMTELAASRTSVSRICSLIARHRPSAVRLTKLQLTDAKQVQVQGQIEAQDTMVAMRSFGSFEAMLRAIPGVATVRGQVRQGESTGRVPFTYDLELGASR